MTRKNREKLNSEEVVCAGKTITIRVLGTGDPDVDKERETEAVKRRHAEISDMIASPSGLSRAKRKRLEAERELLEAFLDARLAGTSKNGPPWDKAEDLLFDKGFRDAHNVAGDRSKEYFRFLIRFSVTFPDYKKSLSRDVLRAYLDNSTKAEEREKARDLLKIAAMQQPLCTPETLRFLRDYLEGDHPLWKLSLSQCAVRMGWIDYQGKPDRKRVRDILREYGIAHGMKGKPGRPRKK